MHAVKVFARLKGRYDESWKAEAETLARSSRRLQCIILPSVRCRIFGWICGILKGVTISFLLFYGYDAMPDAITRCSTRMFIPRTTDGVGACWYVGYIELPTVPRSHTTDMFASPPIDSHRLRIRDLRGSLPLPRTTVVLRNKLS